MDETYFTIEKHISTMNETYFTTKKLFFHCFSENKVNIFCCFKKKLYTCGIVKNTNTLFIIRSDKMIQKLAPLNVTKLDYSQLTELAKQHLGDLKNPANAVQLTPDTPLNDYVIKLESALTAFEVYLKNAQKSEFTEPLLAADKMRETDLRALNRFMRLLEMSESADEQEAFRQLDIVWQVHKNLVNEVDENQTIGIDNLIMDMAAEKLEPYVQTSGISRYLTRVETSNNTYKDILKNRNAEYAERVVKEGIRLRKELLDIYRPYCLFVVSMVNLYPDSEQWSKVLSLLNTVRKKFSALLKQSKTVRDKASDEN